MSLIESNKWKYIYTFFNLENCVDAKFSKNEKNGRGDLDKILYFNINYKYCLQQTKMNFNDLKLFLL